MASASRPVILVFGDSLSAGYGLPAGTAWPNLLQQRLKRQELNYNVINVSISGETTAGGRSRLANDLKRHKPHILILELGSNDGLRGLPLSQCEDNMAYMIRLAQQSGVEKVLLVGARIPPNYGVYADQFAALFPRLARKFDLPLVDFLLAKIATDPKMFLADGIHPTAVAQPILLETVWEKLQVFFTAGN